MIARFPSPLLLVALAAMLASGSFAFSGCARYTMSVSHTTNLPSDATIAVAVVGPQVRKGELTVLEGYLTAALVRINYAVRTLHLEMLVGDPLLKRLFPLDPYSAGKAFASGLSASGELEGEPEFITKALDRTEIVDAEVRLEALVRLTERAPEAWKVQYLLVVHEFAPYGFAGYLVFLPERKIINSFVISANRLGYVKALGTPPASVGQSMNGNDELGNPSRLRYLRLAAYIAKNIL